MLVNLSSINYIRSRPQYINYSRKSIDPAGRGRNSHIIPTMPTCSVIVMLVRVETAVKKGRMKRI